VNRQSFDAVLGIFVSPEYLDVFLVECLEGYRTGNIFKLSTNRNNSGQLGFATGDSEVDPASVLFDDSSTDFSLEIGGQQYSSYDENKALRKN